MIDPQDIEIVEEVIKGPGGRPLRVMTATLKAQWQVQLDGDQVAELRRNNPGFIEDLKDKMRRHIWDLIYDVPGYHRMVDEGLQRARDDVVAWGQVSNLALKPLFYRYDMPPPPEAADEVKPAALVI